MMGHMFNGANYSGNWADMPENMQRMMQNYYGGVTNYSSWCDLAHFVIWVLVIALLVSLIRLIWKKGDKIK